jgi:hypothetical protein
MKRVLSSQIHRAKLINDIIYSTNELEHTDNSVVSELMIELEQMKNNDIELLTTQSYCKCQLINMLNLKHTKDNFVFNFIHVLKYHQLNYHFTQRKSALDSLCVSIEDNDQAQDANDFNKWNKIPILSYGDYLRVRLQNYFMDKSKPVLYDVYLYHYLEEPKLTPSYWKTHTLFNLLKVSELNIPFISNINSYFKNGIDVEALQHIHLILTTEISNGEKITTFVDVAFQDVWNNYNHKTLWKKYIQDKYYSNVSSLRWFRTNSITLDSIKTYTEKDAIKMNLSILKTICEIFNIDLYNPTEMTLTNKQLWNYTATLHQRIPTIYNYLKNVDFSISSTHSTFKKEMYKYIKTQIKEHLDWTIYYENEKHTTRPYDKLCLEPRNRWIDYKMQRDLKPPTFPDRNPHLMELQLKPIQLDKVVMVDKTKEASLVVLLEKGKYIPHTDRLALYKTMLMNAYTDYMLKYSRLDYVEKLMYKTYYHHPTIPMDTNENTYEITYYTPSRNKKTITIPVSHSTVSQFISQDNHFVKTEDKIITRPYSYTEKVIPTLHRPNGSFIEDFVNDLINDVICRIEIKEDLKTLNQNKMLKNIVEL